MEVMFLVVLALICLFVSLSVRQHDYLQSDERITLRIQDPDYDPHRAAEACSHWQLAMRPVIKDKKTIMLNLKTLTAHLKRKQVLPSSFEECYKQSGNISMLNDVWVSGFTWVKTPIK